MSRRVPPDGLDPLTALADGYYLVQKSGRRFRDWYALVAGGNVSITPDAANHQLILSSTASGGGGGGGTGKDRRWNLSSSETTIDEFNDGSLDAAWVRVDGTGAAAGNVSWTEGADVLTSKRLAANTGNVFQGLVRPIGAAPVSGDAWVTCLTHFCPPSTNFSIAGIVVCDGTTHGAGKQVIAESISQASPVATVGTYSLATINWTTASFTSLSTTKNVPLAPLFLRLVYKGSGNWRCDTSPDDVVWRLGGLCNIATFTPSHIGFYSRDGASGIETVISQEFLRRDVGVA